MHDGSLGESGRERNLALTKSAPDKEAEVAPTPPTLKITHIENRLLVGAHGRAPLTFHHCKLCCKNILKISP
jgi:hypothetical protein